MKNKYISQFGRKFKTLSEFKEYLKTLTPDQVRMEYNYLGSEFLTPEVEEMFNICQSALVHINTRWSENF